MIEVKDIPKEFVSIRQAWIKQIDRCAEALSHRFMKDVQDQYSERSGLETFIESVVALDILLIDYGEATVKTDVKKWQDKNYKKIDKDDQGKHKFMSRYRYYQALLGYIVQTLNKYGMLFESQPKGYSNVEMKST